MGLFIVEFDLRARSPITVENGDVIVDRGYSTVTVRNVETGSTDDPANKARLKANALLDELCRQYEINLKIGNSWTVMLQDSPATRWSAPLGLHPYDWTDRVRRVWRGNPLFS